MVNVPGRSKGCKTCRGRKIRCSLERPACRHCIRSGYTCPGYQRDRIFVHSDASTEATKQRHNTKNKQIKRNDTPFVQLKFSLESTSSDVDCSPPESSDSSLFESDSCTTLVNTSFRQQMLVTYFSSYHAMSASSTGETYGCAWLTTAIPSRPSPTKCLETAAYALSLARLGTSLHRKDMVQESLKFYTQGLHRIQRALWDPKFMYSDETLGACMLLAMYEVFQCPSGTRTAYVSHMDGCAKLIQARGAEAHVDGLAHSIFEWFRFTGTTVALESKSTFLSQPSWKHIPFTKFPKTPFQRVLDLLLEAPVIQTRVDELPSLPPSEHLPHVVSIIQDCVAVDQGMQDLYLELELAQGSPLHWESDRTHSGEKELGMGKDPFPVEYLFKDYRTATTMMLSWSTLTILWSGMCHLYRYLTFLTPLTPTSNNLITGTYIPTNTTDPVSFSLPPSTRYLAFPAMARNVCKSVEFCIQDELGLAALACPLMMIVEALGSWPGFEGEIGWARERLERVRGRGMRLAREVEKANEVTGEKVVAGEFTAFKTC